MIVRTTQRALLLSVSLLVLVAAPLGPSAQAQSTEGAQTRRLNAARAHMQAGRYEAAVDALKPLYDAQPSNYIYYSKLKEAYEQLKRYDAAIALVDARIDGAPAPHLIAEKARLVYQKGNVERAFALWDEAIAAAPQSAGSYRVVYQSLLQVRRFRKAIDVVQQARKALDDSTAFRMQLPYLYALTGQHGKAMEEYVALLAENEQQLGFVRSRLQAFVSQGEGIDASLSVLKNAVRQMPRNTAYRELMAWLYMRQRRYTPAFDVYRALDRLQQTQGRALLRFAQRAVEADSFAVASKALDAVLARYDETPIRPQVQATYGRLHERWARTTGDSTHFAAARTAYEAFLQEHPAHEAAPLVQYRLARLQMDVFRRYDAAQRQLEALTSTQHPVADSARFDLGRLAVLEGRLPAARTAFQQVEASMRSGDLAGRARYELALLDFYSGAFEGASARLEGITESRSDDVANDALHLLSLLQTNQSPGDSLHAALSAYATARLQLRQHRYADAHATLDSLLAAHGAHPIADNARFLRAAAYAAQEHPRKAVATYLEIPQMYRQSPLADQALLLAARLQAETLRDASAARDTLLRLLADYPNSLLAPEARAALQRWARPQS